MHPIRAALSALLLAGCATTQAAPPAAPAAAVAAVDTSSLPPRARAEAAIRSLSGCYLVDYSYSETEKRDPAYTLDSRVYDGSRKYFTHEYVEASAFGENGIRLQHVLFARDGTGKVVYVMRHQAEDWLFEPANWLAFVGDGRWEPQKLASGSGQWVRRVDHLDGGPRHACAASWKFDGPYPEFSCNDFAPIPGRETRDMGRKDYDALERSTRVIGYPGSWLERQDNVKIVTRDGGRKPLVREVGKIWYVRQPDSACADAQKFAAESRPFWNVLADAWNEAMPEDRVWEEKKDIDGSPRWAWLLGGHKPDGTEIPGVAGAWAEKVAKDPAAAAEARKAALEVIAKSRR